MIRDILRGQASRLTYALLLRNLLPAYRTMEQSLDEHRGTGPLAALAVREVYRAPSLESDLVALCGPDWDRILPLLPSGAAYAKRVEAAAQGDGLRLIAHAYTRFLGDLNGGRIIRKILGKTLNLDCSCLSFYEFTAVADPKQLTVSYRNAINEIRMAREDQDAVLNEAAEAFQCNIRVSRAVAAGASLRWSESLVLTA